jgi:NAD(P)-dependent dehydrogenase (short-subunit alcohol dehydrogenase family)
MKRLQGKYALITGASQGLGLQMAIAFAREGAAGVAIVARGVELLKTAHDLVQAAAPDTKVLAIVADVSQAADIERIVATTLNEFQGQLNILVNNASTIGPSPMPYLLDYPLEDFRSVLDTNLVAPFLLIKKTLSAMIDRGGSIINVTSDAGVVGYPGWGAYGISKFGLEGLSQTWAVELEGTPMRVNWVDPGNMNTAMHRAAEPDADPTEWADPKTSLTCLSTWPPMNPKMSMANDLKHRKRNNNVYTVCVYPPQRTLRQSPTGTTWHRPRSSTTHDPGSTNPSS